LILYVYVYVDESNVPNKTRPMIVVM
jgi:hypothetical protein